MTMKNLCRILNSLNFSITSKRTLFHESYLGLQKYKTSKAGYSQQEEVKNKLKTLIENPNLRVLTPDLKKFVYLVNTEEDFQIFADIVERYAQSEYASKKDIRFEVFNIGPELLRVYYAMNKAVEALDLLKKPHTNSLICNLRSLTILQDLLYNNGLYQEVCDIFEIIKQKQFNGKIFHFAPYVLHQAACYKLDTPDSYNNVMTLYEKFIKLYKKPYWPFIMYTLMFALKNNSFDIPIKHAVTQDAASVNIKLSALVKSGKYMDALTFCDTLSPVSVIMKSLAEDICKLHGNDGVQQDKSLMEKVELFKKQMDKLNLTDKTLDELAYDVLNSPRPRQQAVF